MEDKQTQALKRLTKKLSALRATLRKDERELLDQLILGEAARMSEVALHGSAPPAPALAAAKSASMISGMIVFDAAKAAYAVKTSAA